MMPDDQKLSLDRAFAYLVLRTSRLLRFHFQNMTTRLGIQLSPEQWIILNRLTHEDGLGQSELISRTFRDRPNVSRMLASMEKKGLVRRKTDTSDMRKSRVFLTTKGRKLHERLIPEVTRERRLVYKGLNAGDFDQLQRILEKIDHNILTSFDEGTDRG